MYRPAAAAAIVLSLAATAAPAAPSGGQLRSGVESGGDASLETRLLVALRCERCGPDSAPAVLLQWRNDAGETVQGVRGLRTNSWSTGLFEIVGDLGVQAVQGVPLEDGWAVEIPVSATDLPLRTQGVLQGFSARQGVHYPQRDAALRNDFVFVPTEDLLEENPSWNPGATAECELTVAKTSSLPVTFVADGEPRAWLFPSSGLDAAASGEWTFQFARPGASALERIDVRVEATESGDAWSFKLPLAAVLGGSLAPKGHRVGIEHGVLDAAPRTPAGLGVRPLDLGACPRTIE